MNLDQFPLNTLILPLLAALFKREISNLYTTWTLYKNRQFDQDGDPNTPEFCQLYNSATGGWADIKIERYLFSFDQNKAGVYILHLLPDGKTAAERIPFLVWDGMRKRNLPTASPEASPGSTPQ